MDYRLHEQAIVIIPDHSMAVCIDMNVGSKNDQNTSVALNTSTYHKIFLVPAQRNYFINCGLVSWVICYQEKAKSN